MDLRYQKKCNPNSLYLKFMFKATLNNSSNRGHLRYQCRIIPETGNGQIYPKSKYFISVETNDSSISIL